MPKLPDDPLFGRVANHYRHGQLAQAIFSALRAAGKDPDNLVPEDLASIDEFHVRGRAATSELARQVSLGPNLHVLDVGSGLGGPARHIAKEYGCRVTGLDLTEEYCQVGTLLTERVGLGGRITFRNGNALDMPFPDATFDVVWTQHVAMNIPDKARLYREMRRVVKPGGRLALYDILAGTGGPVHFPVPWAREPLNSFLATPGELRGLLENAGFDIDHFSDTTAAGLAWFQAVKAKGITTPLGFQVLMGSDFAQMAPNQVRNLAEGRIALVQVAGTAH